MHEGLYMASTGMQQMSKLSDAVMYVTQEAKNTQGSDISDVNHGCNDQMMAEAREAGSHSVCARVCLFLGLGDSQISYAVLKQPCSGTVLRSCEGQQTLLRPCE